MIEFEIDTVGQIISELEDVAYVDKLIKFCKVGYGVLNIWNIRKIAKFLKGSESLSDEEKEKYLAGWIRKINNVFLII